LTLPSIQSFLRSDCPAISSAHSFVSLTELQDKKAIAQNIEQEARYSQALFIWTDCDLEGEHIGGEIRDAALRSNGRLQVRRARFSNIERTSVTFMRLSFFWVIDVEPEQAHSQCCSTIGRVGREADTCRFFAHRSRYTHWVCFLALPDNKPEDPWRTYGRTDNQLRYLVAANAVWKHLLI
jgi:hypothetical protein